MGKKYRIASNRFNLSDPPWTDAIGVEDISEGLSVPSLLMWFTRWHGQKDLAERVVRLLNADVASPTREEKLEAALGKAIAVISDYLAYAHNGDPWEEDARLMGEMEINDYGRDGRLDAALKLLEASK